MTTDTLRRIGEALYGRPWQSQLWHDLGINSRTGRRWLSGARTIPDEIAARLRLAAADARLEKLEESEK